MRRCETLVATREELTTMRDRIKLTIEEEEESLATFKEEQNERILELRLKFETVFALLFIFRKMEDK